MSNNPISIGMVDDDDDYIFIGNKMFGGREETRFEALRPTEDLINSETFGDFDLLIVDVNLQQDFNGFQLAQRMIKTNPMTVIIMLSNEYTKAFKLDCIQLKPILYDKIMNAYKKLSEDIGANHHCIDFRAREYAEGLS